jgi:hypothetical protein
LKDKSTKTAVITGASSGLGAEFARQLAAKGYNLILIARRENRLSDLTMDLQGKYGMTITPLVADLSLISDIEKVIEVIKSNPDIDMLINNAGFGTVGKFSRVDSSQELAMMLVHVIAPVMFCRAILPVLISRNSGSIINVSSMAGILPIRNVLYGSTKSFLVNFSLSLQEELRDSAVRVQALCPGFVYTEFHDTKEYLKFSRSSIPKFLWMTSESVVSESLRSVDKPQVICIPGTIYNLVGTLARNSLSLGVMKSLARLVLRRK